MSKWINVKDRLPEDGKSVLTYGAYSLHGNYRVRIGSIYLSASKINYWLAAEGTLEFCTHWQPLPDPPEAPGKE